MKKLLSIVLAMVLALCMFSTVAMAEANVPVIEAETTEVDLYTWTAGETVELTATTQFVSSTYTANNENQAERATLSVVVSDQWSEIVTAPEGGWITEPVKTYVPVSGTNKYSVSYTGTYVSTAEYAPVETGEAVITYSVTFNTDATVNGAQSLDTISRTATPVTIVVTDSTPPPSPAYSISWADPGKSKTQQLVIADFTVDLGNGENTTIDSYTVGGFKDQATSRNFSVELDGQSYQFNFTNGVITQL